VADGDEAEPQRQHLVLEPRPRWGVRNLAEVWQFRSLLGQLARRDITLRYRQTALGVIWVVLQPLIAAGLFAVVFGRVAHLSSNGVPYVVFSYAGLLAWNMFSTYLSKASASLVGNSALVSKVYFPRIVLPLSTMAGTVLDFVVSLVMMAVLLVATSTSPGWGLALLPVWVLILLLLTTGIGLLMASLAVKYRDVNYVLPVLVQFLLYASPVAYALSAVPHSLRPYFVANPLTGLLEAYRWSLLGTGSVHAGYLLYSAAFAVVVLVAGSAAFARMERSFADVI
jgi:lipopolysaccharide transport system permease protein